MSDNLPIFPSERSALIAAAKKYHLEARERIRAFHQSGDATGSEVVRKLTAHMDDLIRALIRSAIGDKPPFDVIAVGGYGRGELNPCSDIDVLFLCNNPDAKEIKVAIENILYPLWDLKFDVGHSVRNVKSCIEMAEKDYTVLTGLLSMRTIVGNGEGVSALWGKLEKSLFARTAPAFLKEKAIEINERRKKFGDSVYMLEPNVKESPGALRDYHTALWIAQIVHKSRSADELTETAIIPPAEKAKVEIALDFIWSIRNEIHFQSGRKDDRLTFHNQEKIALFMGYRDKGDHKAVELFMRDYYLHADTLRHFTNRLIEECLDMVEKKPEHRGLGGGLFVSRGELAAEEDLLGNADLSKMLAIFKTSLDNNVRLSSSLSHMIEEAMGKSRLPPPTDAQFAEFFALFDSREGVAAVIEDMHESGVLKSFIPEFESLRRQVQHDAYHIYTTDLHSILTMRELEDLRNGEVEREYPFFVEVASQVQDWPLLLLTGLLHDVGKGMGKGHSERGAEMASNIAQRLGLSEERRDKLVFLIKNHLEMAIASQKRDLADPSLIARFAKTVEDEETLKMLALLTIADQRGVGPEGWSDWKRALLIELYVKTIRVLEKGAESFADVKARRERAKKSLVEIVGNDISMDRIDFNLKAMPQRFFLTRTAANMARCLKVIERLKDGDVLVTGRFDDDERKDTEFVVSAWDAPGIFSKMAGVLSYNGINILGADIYTRSDGAALDIFRLSRPDEALSSTAGKWERIEQDIEAALTGKLKVAEKVAKRKKPIISTKRAPYRPPRVEFDLESSETATIIEVYAHDRVGLLYEVTNALTELSLYIDRAIIATELDQAADVFYVKDIFGHKITGEEKLKKISARLITALQEKEQN